MPDSLLSSGERPRHAEGGPVSDEDLRTVPARPAYSQRPRPSSRDVRSIAGLARARVQPRGPAHITICWCRQNTCRSSLVKFLTRRRFLPAQIESLAKPRQRTSAGTVVHLSLAYDLLQSFCQ